nr:hypothetical protein L204_01572 [Cryptococcus depauperatus CBS 7855]
MEKQDQMLIVAIKKRFYQKYYSSATSSDVVMIATRTQRSPSKVRWHEFLYGSLHESDTTDCDPLGFSDPRHESPLKRLSHVCSCLEDFRDKHSWTHASSYFRNSFNIQVSPPRIVEEEEEPGLFASGHPTASWGNMLSLAEAARLIADSHIIRDDHENDSLNAKLIVLITPQQYWYRGAKYFGDLQVTLFAWQWICVLTGAFLISLRKV